MTITLKNAADDFAAELEGQTLAGITLVDSENLFSRPSIPVPMATCVYITNTGGEEPMAMMGVNASVVLRPTVQALVYSTPGDDGFDEGDALARAVFAAMQQIGPSLSGYLTAMAQQSGPQYLGQEPETQRHAWSMDFTLTYQT